MSYRPTNEQCLPRNETSPELCEPCTEGLWLSLMSQVQLADGIYSMCNEPDNLFDEYYATVGYHVLQLGPYRNKSQSGKTPMPKESIKTAWTFNGNPWPEMDNQLSINITDSERPPKGTFSFYTMTMVLETSAIRKDPQNMLTYRYGFGITDAKCGAVDVSILPINARRV